MARASNIRWAGAKASMRGNRRSGGLAAGGGGGTSIRVPISKTHDLVGCCKNVVGDDSEAAVAVIHEPVAGLSAELGHLIGQKHLEGMLQLNREYVVRQTHVASRPARDRGRHRPVFVAEFAMGNTPLVAAVARQDRISRMSVNRSFRGAND